MPGRGVVGEEVGDQALGVALDRDLQLAAGALRRGGRVAAGVADAVDLDRDLDELAGAEALPGAVGAQGQGDAVRGAVLDRDDLGPALAGHQRRADLLEVAVDPVRAGDQVEQAPAGNARRRDGAAAVAVVLIDPPLRGCLAAIPVTADQRNIKCRHGR